MMLLTPHPVILWKLKIKMVRIWLLSLVLQRKFFFRFYKISILQNIWYAILNTHTHTHVSVRMHACICICECMDTYIYIYVFVCRYMCACMYNMLLVNIYVQFYTHININEYICIHVHYIDRHVKYLYDNMCVCVCVYVFMCVCAFVYYI